MTSPTAGRDLGNRRLAEAAVRGELARSHRELQGFLTRRLGDASEADEVLQTFVLRALERGWSLRDVGSVRGWLGRVLTTTLIDYQRRGNVRGRREQLLDGDDLDRLAVEPDVEVDQAVCQCLYGILPTLKPEYREVISRVDIGGSPREQVAAELGTTANNVTVRLHRARRALRRRLEEFCSTCPEHGFLDCGCPEQRP